MDLNEAKYNPDGQLSTFQDETSEIAPGMKYEMSSLESSPDADNEVFLKRRLPDSDKLALASESASLDSFPVKCDDKTERREGFTSPEQHQSELNTSTFLESILTKFKCEKEEVEDDLADPLHTSIEIKNEDPSNLNECEDQDFIKDDEYNFKDDIHGLPPYEPMTSRITELSLNDQHLEQLPRMIGENTNIYFHANGQELNTAHSIQANKEIKGDKSLICSYCSTRIKRKCDLKAHVRTHTGERPFSCSHCPARFTRKNHVTRHMRTHTGERPFSCSQCSACFAEKGHLNAHLRTHTGEKRFSCSHCSARFTRKNDLTRHMRTHNGERPFSCSQCSACFAEKGHLNAHLRTHTGEKPFICSHCSARFNRKTNLNAHMRTHTNEKPFVCSHCSACFVQKGHLNEHLRMHTGEKPFKCSHCSACFKKAHTLKRHTRYHTGEKSFSVIRCSASFTQKLMKSIYFAQWSNDKRLQTGKESPILFTVDTESDNHASQPPRRIEGTSSCEVAISTKQYRVNCARPPMNLNSEIKTEAGDVDENLFAPLHSSIGNEQEVLARTSGN